MDDARDGAADDVGLDGEPQPEVPIYSHGYSLRVALLVSADEADAALSRIGWPDASAGWRGCQLRGATRWTLQGTAFLSQRRPRNKRLALTRRNREWKTNIYSLQVERSGQQTWVDVHGVRRGDVERLLQDIVRFEPSQYEVSYYRSMERYVALTTVEALRLAEALGCTPTAGRGRIARKRFLIRDYKVPVVVRRRTRRVARLCVYRVVRGATCAYKCEIRLVGKRRDRGHFDAADIPRLDEALLALLEEHEVSVIEKPARWEPRSDERWGRDRRLEMLPAAAYRGNLVPRAAVRAAEKCHTPNVALVGICCAGTDTCSALPYIRQHESLTRSSNSGKESEIRQEGLVEQGLAEQGGPAGQGSQCPVGRIRNRGLWGSIARDILRCEGLLEEVILDPEQSPEPFLRSLVEKAPPGSVAINALCAVGPDGTADTWQSVIAMMADRPVTDQTETLVLVVDPSIHCAVSDAVSVCDEEGGHFEDGPLVPPVWQWDRLPLLVRAAGAWLFDLMRKLRELCERAGFRVVLVTADARPDHGRGELTRTHFFHDARVRSIVGDAGRYWCHCRYLVEQDRRGRPRRAVMVKDEVEGLMGRVVSGPAELPAEKPADVVFPDLPFEDPYDGWFEDVAGAASSRAP